MLRAPAISLLLLLPAAAAPVDFTTQIRPILSDNCFACHGPDPETVKAELRLDLRARALKGGETRPAIVPGKPAESLLLERITAHDADDLMPPPKKKNRLKPEQVQLLTRWIEEGAPWGEHWAFQPPKRPAIPAVKNTAWPQNPIDHFVLARLEAEGLEPSPPAPANTLLRRLSLDLTGLPPTLDELREFKVALRSPEGEERAIEETVDALLASPHFGERWAREWLDAARYADSSGYEKDLPREMHFYRDWVVQAMNNNMPYNDFVIRQIAGDLLPNPTQDDHIATGFLRHSMTNEEGGANPEQFRIEGIIDRMDAIGKSVLGLTMQCAQCHSHKFDPLTQEEYYGIFAFLNSTSETSYPAYTPDEQRKIAGLKQQIATLERALPDARSAYQTWQDALLALPPTEWHTMQLSQLGDPGQRYQRLEDDSMINMGYAATKSTENFSFSTALPEIRSVRLKLLNDPYLSLQGPGRSSKGTGALSEFKLQGGPETSKLAELKFTDPVASVNPPHTALDPARYPKDASRKPDDRVTGPAAYALDGDEKTAWCTDLGPGRSNDPQLITFNLAEPLLNPGTLHFKFPLIQKHGGYNSDDVQSYNLGRFLFQFASTLPNALDHLSPLVREALETPADQRTPEQAARLFSHWRESNPAFAETTAKIEALWQQHPVPATALVASAVEKPRPTHLFERGEQTHPKQEVQPHVPAFLHPLPAGDPTSRLTFAKWLADPHSPTTARYQVNRIWQAYFGLGLLETSEDFGVQSAQPSHPALLDWLAVEFMESGWDLKHIHQLITTSATYQQDSNLDSALRERDPRNRLLARGPRLRVPAETVRDIQLAASGLLNPTLGGRSVFPPAPAYLFEKPASYGPKTWFVEQDAQRYRRALYTFRFRSVTYPMLLTFDAPTGEIACVRRTTSTTPLQALVTLNEQVSVECALGLAHLMLTQDAPLEDRITTAFQRCTSRTPQPDELAILTDLYNSELAAAQKDPAPTKALLAQHQPVTLDLSILPLPELAATTAIARTLLNLDETITKE